MLQSTFNQRFEALRNRRKNAEIFFAEAIAPYLVATEQANKETASRYFFMKYISSTLMISKSFEEFVARCIMDKEQLLNKNTILGIDFGSDMAATPMQEAQSSLKEWGENIHLAIPEDFDWVGLCVRAGMIHAGKGPDRLTQYSYIHASFEIINYYELKILRLMLDEMEGKDKGFTEFLTKIDEAKGTQKYTKAKFTKGK